MLLKPGEKKGVSSSASARHWINHWINQNVQWVTRMWLSYTSEEWKPNCWVGERMRDKKVEADSST